MRDEVTTDSSRPPSADGSAPASLATISRRDSLIIWTCLVSIIVLAWAYLFVLDRQMASSTAYDTMMAEMGMAMAACFGTAVAMSLATWWLGMRSGVRALDAMGG